jgi:UDP-N-acetylmuramoyl-tripeptide--D-alanyl-D-alanine ligase
MLELGADGPALHAGLCDAVDEAAVDLVFAAGPQMAALFDRLPPERRGAWASSAADLEKAVLNALAPGDVVMVKGSNGSKMGPLVAAILEKFSHAGPAETRPPD